MASASFGAESILLRRGGRGTANVCRPSHALRRPARHRQDPAAGARVADDRGARGNVAVRARDQADRTDALDIAGDRRRGRPRLGADRAVEVEPRATGRVPLPAPRAAIPLGVHRPGDRAGAGRRRLRDLRAGAPPFAHLRDRRRRRDPRGRAAGGGVVPAARLLGLHDGLDDGRRAGRRVAGRRVRRDQRLRTRVSGQGAGAERAPDRPGLRRRRLPGDGRHPAPPAPACRAWCAWRRSCSRRAR